MSRPPAPVAIASAVLCTLFACAGPPDPATAGDATPDDGATAAPAASSAPAIDVVDEAPAPEGKAAAPTAAAGPSEAKLRASKALGPDEPFPEIELVSKEIGPPSTSGKAQRRQWRYGQKPLGKSFSCETVDLIRLPSGGIAFDTSVLTSPDCRKVKTTEAQVIAVLDTLGGAPEDAATRLELRIERTLGKKFDEVAALFEKKLGRPQESGEPAIAAWRYTADDETCRVVIVTSHLGSGAGQAIWGVPCE